LINKNILRPFILITSPGSFSRLKTYDPTIFSNDFESRTDEQLPSNSWGPPWLSPVTVIHILQLLQNPLSVLQISGILGILQIPAAVPLSIVEKKLVSKLDGNRIGPWDAEDKRHSSHDSPRCLKTNSNPKIGWIANFQTRSLSLQEETICSIKLLAGWTAGKVTILLHWR